jgi:hypothetical protein
MKDEGGRSFTDAAGEPQRLGELYYAGATLVDPLSADRQSSHSTGDEVSPLVLSSYGGMFRERQPSYRQVPSESR